MDQYKTGDITISNGRIRLYINEEHTKGYFINDTYATYVDRRNAPEMLLTLTTENVVCTLSDVFEALLRVRQTQI